MPTLLSKWEINSFKVEYIQQAAQSYIYKKWCLLDYINSNVKDEIWQLTAYLQGLFPCQDYVAEYDQCNGAD